MLNLLLLLLGFIAWFHSGAVESLMHRESMVAASSCCLACVCIESRGLGAVSGHRIPMPSLFHCQSALIAPLCRCASSGFSRMYIPKLCWVIHLPMEGAWELLPCLQSSLPALALSLEEQQTLRSCCCCCFLSLVWAHIKPVLALAPLSCPCPWSVSLFPQLKQGWVVLCFASQLRRSLGCEGEAAAPKDWFFRASPGRHANRSAGDFPARLSTQAHLNQVLTWT